MIIQTNSGEISENSGEILPLAHADRAKRGLQAFAAFFGLALLSILIPVMHFFLVPLFLFLSVFMGISKYRQNHFVDLTIVHCPKCGKNLNEKKTYFKGELLKVYCYKCRSGFRIY